MEWFGLKVEDDVGFLLRPVAAAVAADRGAEVVPGHADRHFLGVDADASSSGLIAPMVWMVTTSLVSSRASCNSSAFFSARFRSPPFLDHGLVVGDLASEGQLLGVELRHQRVEDVIQEVLQGGGWRRLVVAHLPVLRQTSGSAEAASMFSRMVFHWAHRCRRVWYSLLPSWSWWDASSEVQRPTCSSTASGCCRSCLDHSASFAESSSLPSGPKALQELASRMTANSRVSADGSSEAM